MKLSRASRDREETHVVGAVSAVRRGRGRENALWGRLGKHTK